MRTTFFALACLAPLALSQAYLIGTGIGDVTGPAAEVNLMGYAAFNQTAAGVHTRLFSRAYVVVDEATDTRIAFASVDWGMASQSVKTMVIQRLQAEFGDVYSDQNVCLSGTHTHSSPAGFLQYVLYQITSLGYVNESAMAYADGIYESIAMAHNNLQNGTIKWNWGELTNANINRSPSAYLANPAEERALYSNNTDFNMTVLRFDTANSSAGMIAWFAVHGTSVNNTNRLLSSDNKGYAALVTELAHNPGELPGKGSFVAAFPSTNLGDVSPNTNGTICSNSGLPCDFYHSTCDGRNEYCVGRGPGQDMYDSMRIIGERQAEMGESLFQSASEELSGPVSFIHTYVDMSNVTLTVNGTEVTTCLPAMGYSFAAGTTDGPGAFNFTQGDAGTGTPFWNFVRDLIATPSPAEVACQAPKPILLPTGETTKPYAWDPTIVPLQILRIGQFFLVAVPSEFTTMAGRRLRNAVRASIIANGGPADAVVVISGLSNSYSSYVTTFEEYQIQRYEGASTIFGPHTHQAYVNQFEALAAALVTNTPYPAGPSPPNFMSEQWSLLPGVIFDSTPAFKNFGDVLTDVNATYSPGDLVSCTFVSANPRNNPMRGGTFLTVEQSTADNEWTVLYTDAHYETKYYWLRESVLSSKSNARITWAIPANVTGKFRIQHFGTSKALDGTLSAFSGTSSVFIVQ